MKNILKSNVLPVGLAIFSMFFGAGNLMYPLQVGMLAGDKTIFGIAGFILTAVCLPVVGLIGMILFDGDYHAFFNRLGKKTGSLFILVCMLVIGPMIVMPRIATLSHTMIAPFIPIPLLTTITPLSSFIFSIIFFGLTFLGAFRESKIIDVLGYIISPLLLISLIIIIIKGFIGGAGAPSSSIPAFSIFKESLRIGYETLDLLAGIFFSSIILTTLKQKIGEQFEQKPHFLALLSLKAGIIGTSLLGIIYIGMSFLSAFHSHGLTHINPGELFRELAFNVLGTQGAAVIGTAVLMACFSTSIALGAVVGDYLQRVVCNNKIGFIPALVIILLLSIPLSTAGLTKVLELTAGPLTYIGYPVLIALTFSNIAYKLFGFKPVKIPVLLTFAVTLISYIW